MENTLTLYVRYLAKPGCRETFLRQLTTHGIIDAIRREDGCLRYDYFLPVQNADVLFCRTKSRYGQNTVASQPEGT